MTPTCNEGKCSLNWDTNASHCGSAEAGKTPDCETLRTTYLKALALAQQCDPTENPPKCDGDYADTCGCEAPYDISGTYANAVECAFNAWSDAHCPLVACGRTCVTPTKACAACVTNSSGTTGTCAWK